MCPVALSDRKGRGRLLLPEHCGWARLVTEVQNGDSVIDVSVEILDDYLDSVEANRPIAFLKCDVEGHETAVFRGATRLLTMDRPVLLFESAPLMHVPKNGHPPFEFLKALGYEGYFFCDSELVPIECYSSAEHVLTNQVIQNYVFLHPTTASLVKDRFPYRVQHNPAISILRRAA